MKNSIIALNIMLKILLNIEKACNANCEKVRANMIKIYFTKPEIVKILKLLINSLSVSPTLLLLLENIKMLLDQELPLLLADENAQQFFLQAVAIFKAQTQDFQVHLDLLTELFSSQCQVIEDSPKNAAQVYQAAALNNFYAQLRISLPDALKNNQLLQTRIHEIGAASLDLFLYAVLKNPGSFQLGVPLERANFSDASVTNVSFYTSVLTVELSKALAHEREKDFASAMSIYADLLTDFKFFLSIYQQAKTVIEKSPRLQLVYKEMLKGVAKIDALYMTAPNHPNRSDLSELSLEKEVPNLLCYSSKTYATFEEIEALLKEETEWGDGEKIFILGPNVINSKDLSKNTVLLSTLEAPAYPSKNLEWQPHPLITHFTITQNDLPVLYQFFVDKLSSGYQPVIHEERLKILTEPLHHVYAQSREAAEKSTMAAIFYRQDGQAKNGQPVQRCDIT